MVPQYKLKNCLKIITNIYLSSNNPHCKELFCCKICFYIISSIKFFSEQVRCRLIFSLSSRIRLSQPSEAQSVISFANTIRFISQANLEFFAYDIARMSMACHCGIYSHTTKEELLSLYVSLVLTFQVANWKYFHSLKFSYLLETAQNALIRIFC